MRKERILLLGGNYYPEPTGIGKYSGEMMDWLSINGYECGVVTTFPYYPYWKIQAPYAKHFSIYKKEERCVKNGEPIKIHRCLHYVPTIPIGSKRVLSDLSFFVSAFFQICTLLFRKKYDYVIIVAPPFQLGLLGLIYRKLKGAKVIYHNQDLQIDAANQLGMIKSKFLTQVMFGLERLIMRKADFVSCISEGMTKKIKEKWNREVILFPNWADTKIFHPIVNKVEIKRRFDFSVNDKIVLYSGAIGEKQGLQTLLHCARELSFRKEIKFIICGSGPYKEKLVSMCEEMCLSNVIFMSLQPRENFNQLLNLADVHLVLQKSNMNDMVMPSKLTTIFSVGGLAIVTADKETSLCMGIVANNIGLVSEPENQSALTATIIKAVDYSHLEIRHNARKYAENHLAIDDIIVEFLSQIKEPQKGKIFNKEKGKPWKVKVNAN